MQIAVTGHAGRIGRCVVRDLVGAGHRVKGLDVVHGLETGLRQQLVDLTDAGQVYGALAGAAAVVHVGAWANAGMVPDTRTYADNVTGTYNVLQACADLQIRRVVSASSAQVYGLNEHAPAYLPVDEDHPLRPLSCYSLSKITGEQAAAYFCDRHGLEVLSFRFMGVRAPEELPAQIEGLRADPAAGKGLLWTRTDARDVARACRLAIETEDVEPGIYNIAGSEVVVDEETATLVGEHFGERTEIRSALPGWCSPMTCAKATAAFGYAPGSARAASPTGSQAATGR